MNYRFTLAGGNEYGSAFALRIAVSSLDGTRLLRAGLMPTVNIQDGTAISTTDARTMQVLDDLIAAGDGALGRGVTVQKNVAGTRTVNYDTATAAARVGR